jgi:hypothetical protein
MMKAANKDSWKLRPKSELIIALDDLDFSWFPEEVRKVKQLWNQGLHIAAIAAKVKRDQDEVAILIMHLARAREIQNRKMGVLGH